MSSDKCSNCKTTKSHTFWTFEDHTVLCDKCHKQFGKKWQKEIDENKGIKREGSSLKALIIGIIGFIIVFFELNYLSIGLGIVALIFGIIGLTKIHGNHKLKGKGLAITGIVLGSLAIFFALAVISQGSSPQTDNSNSISNVQDTQIRLYCGDGYCNNGESCSTCSTDCGQCAKIVQQTNLEKIKQVTEEYHQSHTYTLADLFVCTDMSIEVWNLLKTQGIDAKICAGNIDTKYTDGLLLLKNMNHAWVLAETEPFKYIAVETTGGYLVWGSGLGGGGEENDLYYSNKICFDNPKNFKNFIDLRTQFYSVCTEADNMRNYWNQNIVGTKLTASTSEYKGRMDAKIQECNTITTQINTLVG